MGVKWPFMSQFYFESDYTIKIYLVLLNFLELN